MDRRRAAWAALAALALLAFVAAVWEGGRLGRAAAIAELRRSASNAMALHLSALRSELEKQRALPAVLAQDAELLALLRGRAGPGAAEPINRRLEELSHAARAAVIYALDANGRTLAASNWREPTSFVGQNYAFRRYFQEAMARGAFEQFALGTVSGRPGYYLSGRAEDAAGPAGIVVVKLEFDAIEADWRTGGDRTYATDAQGVVVVTDRPEWRFRTARALAPERRQQVREEFQVAASDLEPLPFRPPEAADGALVETDASAATPGGPALHLMQPVPTTDWSLHTLTPLRPVVDRAERQAQAIAGLGTLAAAFAAGFGLLVRQRRLERARRQEEARAELETQVALRTRELTDAKSRLEAEMEERQRAETAARTLGDQLVQANKLATLGQLAASVAHEVNQPLAAIRAYADNGAVMLDRDRAPDARENLVKIGGLTTRIARITSELKAFGRKASGAIGPVSAQAAIEGSLMLLNHRLLAQGVAVDADLPAEDVLVRGELVRVEQVIVNLLQNALDATRDVAAPHVAIRLRAANGHASLVVSDNGPGIDPSTMANLFTAFATTKPEGLGLGLAICRDIVRDFGGDIVAASDASGATFTVTLPLDRGSDA
ncbi:two-component sensor histidine kinase [Alsobacter metallidurans]|uniref:C4-dicarboxylate transport sensor protein DctB n=1 Tax=Alsobacter metallidurans TaxID=340221 RepID=A0A917MGS3_9HYPH|nr:ATP-binding protein [Alsobacter metallidurans]GGH12667.1 two-component sensor histidine kinase [Alsobacter metallidurans]